MLRTKSSRQITVALACMFLFCFMLAFFTIPDFKGALVFAALMTVVIGICFVVIPHCVKSISDWVNKGE